MYGGDEIEDEQIYIENKKNINVNKLGPTITREVLYKVLKDLRDKKAKEVDKIPAEVLKNLGNATTEKLINIITDCYKKRMMPNDFITSKYN